MKSIKRTKKKSVIQNEPFLVEKKSDGFLQTIQKLETFTFVPIGAKHNT